MEIYSTNRGAKMTKENYEKELLDFYYMFNDEPPTPKIFDEIGKVAERLFANVSKHEGIDHELRVMPKIAGIVWEQRYSKTLDNDKFGRWMRIGRINEMTVAIITKAEVENKPTRYVVRLPNNTGNESLQNDIITLSENEAMLEAEKYIAKYVSNFTA